MAVRQPLYLPTSLAKTAAWLSEMMRLGAVMWCVIFCILSLTFDQNSLPSPSLTPMKSQRAPNFLSCYIYIIFKTLNLNLKMAICANHNHAFTDLISTLCTPIGCFISYVCPPNSSCIYHMRSNSREVESLTMSFILLSLPFFPTENLYQAQ